MPAYVVAMMSIQDPQTYRELRAPAGFRRIGRDMLDTEMLQCPADLRRAGPVDLSAGLRRGKIMTAPIGVEAQR